jgi:UDP-glucose 4-epimerase
MIVVVGAGGFIGSYLVDTLVGEGFDLVAADISDVAREHYDSLGVPFVRLDITRREDFDALPSSGVEAVVHVACLQPVDVSEEAYDPMGYVRVNVIGTLNILEYCRGVGVGTVVYTISHRGVQALWDKGDVITEEVTQALKYAGDYAMYAISECAASDCVRHYAEKHGLRGVILRLPPVYGYGPHFQGYREGKPVKAGFSVFIDKAIGGETIELWGDVDCARDIIYVKDVVTAIVMVLRNEDARGLYNIASGVKTSLRRQAEETVEVFTGENGRSSLVYRPELPNQVESFIYDISKAKRELGWSPRYGLREMFQDIKVEMESRRFEYLVEGREKKMTSEKMHGGREGEGG